MLTACSTSDYRRLSLFHEVWSNIWRQSYKVAYMRSEVLMAVNMSTFGLSVVTPCAVVRRCQHLEGTYLLPALKMEAVCSSEMLPCTVPISPHGVPT
jgi:hypothetical protein